MEPSTTVPLTIRQFGKEPIVVDIQLSHPFFILYPPFTEGQMKDHCDIKTLQIGTDQEAFILALDYITSIGDFEEFWRNWDYDDEYLQTTNPIHVKMLQYFEDIFTYICREGSFVKLHYAAQFIYGGRSSFDEFIEKMLNAYALNTIFHDDPYNRHAEYFTRAFCDERDESIRKDPVMYRLFDFIMGKIPKQDGSFLSKCNKLFNDQSYFNLLLFIKFESIADYYLKYFLRSDSWDSMSERCVSVETWNKSVLGKFFLHNEKDIDSIKKRLYEHYQERYNWSINQMKQSVKQGSKPFNENNQDILEETMSIHFESFGLSIPLREGNLLGCNLLDAYLVVRIISNRLLGRSNPYFEERFDNLKKVLVCRVSDNPKYQDIIDVMDEAIYRRKAHKPKLRSDETPEQMRLTELAIFGQFLCDVVARRR